MRNATTSSGILGAVLCLLVALQIVVRPISPLEAGHLRLGESQSQAQDVSQKQPALTAPEPERSHQVQGAISLPPSPIP
jgi:hypothetical protein